jgi:hypothetical protein
VTCRRGLDWWILIWYSQVVSTSNYNTVTDFHTTNHSMLIFSVLNTVSSYIRNITVTTCITHEITSSTSVNSATLQLPSEFSSTEFSSPELSTELFWTDSSTILEPLMILRHGPYRKHSSTVAWHRPHRNHMSCDPYPVSWLARWLDLEKMHILFLIFLVGCDWVYMVLRSLLVYCIRARL